MNRVAIRKPSGSVTFYELAFEYGSDAVRLTVADHAQEIFTSIDLDSADLAALKVFIDGRIASLTPGGD